jgi:LEA14-like dessication related protein
MVRGKSMMSSCLLSMVVVVLIMVLHGCAYTKLLTSRLEKPTFTYLGTELVGVSERGVVVNFLFSAHNPNETGIRNVICSYELSVDGNTFLTGMDVPVTLTAKGDTEIRVPASIDREDFRPVLRSVVRRIFSGKKTLPVTIDAVFSGKPALYGEAGKEQPLNFEMRFIKKAEIPLPLDRSTGGS